MLRTIALVSLLVYAVCAVHWEVREVDSTEDEFEELADYHMTEGQKTCWLCQKFIKMVKKKISSNATPDEIKTKLTKFCAKFRIFRDDCEELVKKHLHILVDELMADDGPKTICTKIKACKSEPPIKEFIIARDQANDNF